jgi:hypothetical protein
MYSQKRHKINYLKLPISIVLLILFAYNSYNGLKNPYDSLLHSGLFPFGATYNVYVNAPQSSTINNCIPLLNFSKFYLFNNYYKELVQTSLLGQIIAISEKISFTRTIIKPPGFYYYFSKRETDEDLILS